MRTLIVLMILGTMIAGASVAGVEAPFFETINQRLTSHEETLTRIVEIGILGGLAQLVMMGLMFWTANRTQAERWERMADTIDLKTSSEGALLRELEKHTLQLQALNNRIATHPCLLDTWYQGTIEELLLIPSDSEAQREAIRQTLVNLRARLKAP